MRSCSTRLTATRCWWTAAHRAPTCAAELEDQGVSGLAAAIVTHDQSDHAGGIAELLGSFPVHRLLYGQPSPDLIGAARSAGVRAMAIAEGSEVDSGSLRIEVLWPPRALLEEPRPDDLNQASVVLLARWRRFSMLLTADAEAEAVPIDPGPVDVLKVAHHGSDDAGLDRLLDRSAPRLAVISVGADNPYGHPSAATLATLAEHRVPTVRTDRERRGDDRGQAGRLAGRDRGLIGTRPVSAPPRRRCRGPAQEWPRLRIHSAAMSSGSAKAQAAIKPAYLIAGTDEGKIDAALSRLRARAEREGGPGALESFAPSAGGQAPDADALIAAIPSMSLMASRRYLLADGVERWTAKQAEAVIAELGSAAAGRHRGAGRPGAAAEGEGAQGHRRGRRGRRRRGAPLPGAQGARAARPARRRGEPAGLPARARGGAAPGRAAGGEHAAAGQRATSGWRCGRRRTRR